MVRHEAAQQDFHFHANPVNDGFEEPFIVEETSSPPLDEDPFS